MNRPVLMFPTVVCGLYQLQALQEQQVSLVPASEPVVLQLPE